MIKVLLISSSYPQSKKSYRGIFIHKIMKELLGMGCEIHVVTGVEAGKRVSEYEGIKIHQFDLPPVNLSDFGPRNFLSWLQYSRTMLAYAKKTAGQINPDIIHGCWAVPGGLVAYRVGRSTGKPVLVTFLGSGLRVGHRIPVVRSILKHYLNRVDCMVSDDASEMFLYADRIGVTNPNRIHIPAGTDVDHFAPGEPARSISARYRGRRVLLLVGWLRKVRGQDFAVRCMPEILRKVPNAVLVLAGDGPTRKEVEALARETGVHKSVDFAGNVDNACLVDYYNLAEVVLFASDTCNYSTASLFEAAACGAAIVATDARDTELVVKPGKTGLLARYGDVQGFSSAVVTMMESGGLRKICRENVRKLAVSNFSLKKSAERYYEAYRKIAE
ncbi:MAG: glycosyltransferase [archaeon]